MFSVDFQYTNVCLFEKVNRRSYQPICNMNTLLKIMQFMYFEAASWYLKDFIGLKITDRECLYSDTLSSYEIASTVFYLNDAYLFTRLLVKLLYAFQTVVRMQILVMVTLVSYLTALLAYIQERIYIYILCPQNPTVKLY